VFKKISFFVWLIIVVGIAISFIGDTADQEWFFNFYKTVIELYLFGFTSFMILKRVFFYKIKGNIDVIRLVKKSEYQSRLFWQGTVLALIYLAYNRYFLGTLEHSNSIMIFILLLYYLVQILINSNPSIYIDEHSFSYDDYFVDRWKWRKIQRIDMENDKMRLIGNNKDFELNFNLVDEIDYIKLNDEVEQNILDGEFTSEKSSKTLIEIVQNYANRYGVRFVNLGENYF
jgi:hypothetical protein